ncbi:MAG UNVERIFIED_CONTAM: amidohydrolase family protein [Planctomycetaceae bacterium]
MPFTANHSAITTITTPASRFQNDCDRPESASAFPDQPAQKHGTPATCPGTPPPPPPTGSPGTKVLKSITLYPAQILGVADRLGSLEPGRDATLFVSTGDPLETDPQVTNAWIQGRRVDLSSRHSQLYQKYQEKYRQLALP